MTTIGEQIYRNEFTPLNTYGKLRILSEIFDAWIEDACRRSSLDELTRLAGTLMGIVKIIEIKVEMEMLRRGVEK